MNDKIDPKEIKILSDILALVLEEQEGQSAAALKALRNRARRNNLTGGALKNLFTTIAASPPRARARGNAARNAARADKTGDGHPLRQQITTLTQDLQQLDLKLRYSESRAASLHQELQQAHQSRAALQELLASRQMRKSSAPVMLWWALAAGICIGVASMQFIDRLAPQPHIDKSVYLN